MLRTTHQPIRRPQRLHVGHSFEPNFNMPQSHTLKKVDTDLYVRGAQNMHYVHKRIPIALSLAYPPKKTHITLSLHTSDRAKAMQKLPNLLAKIEAEFEQMRYRIDLSRANQAPVRATKLTASQRKGVLDFWARQIMLADDKLREPVPLQSGRARSQQPGSAVDEAGFDDDEFDELQAELATQRETFGKMLARGQVLPFAATLLEFMYLCGIHYVPAVEELQEASREFLARLVKVLDWRLQRMDGLVVITDEVTPEVVHPLYLVAPERAPKALLIATWDLVFENWRDFVKNRPETTTVANNTAWRDLRRFAEMNGVTSPSDVTPELMKEFVEDMVRRIGVNTLNDRLEMVRKIYRKAVRDGLVKVNPAENTDGKQLSNAEKRKQTKKRQPFSRSDLERVFSSQVYREHRRSEGQSGEATYWIPVIMYFTGARPEEVAGLALADLQQDESGRWFFNILDRYCDEDAELFDEDPIPLTHMRTLKNAASRRKIPVAQELLDLGLMRYVDHVRQSGAAVFFPTLQPDRVGKLSGAFVKVFSRIKRLELGIKDSRKVLYSFRHTMKDLLEAARVPSKVLRRILGHTTGDGGTTDGYGSDLAFEIIVEEFDKVRFPAIPALPWEPGRGLLNFPKGQAIEAASET